MSVLLFVPLGSEGIDPYVLGAVAVPPCFRPTDDFIERAAASGVTLVVAVNISTIPEHLAESGQRYFERLKP